MNKSRPSLIHDPDDSGRRSKIVRLIANVLVGLLVIGGWYYFLSTPVATNASGDASVSGLRKEFGMISIPSRVSATDGIVVSSKGWSSLVRQGYFTENSPDIIFEYYDKKLSNLGWVYLRDIYGGRGAGKIYCKGGKEAAIEIISQEANNGLQYSFSISSGEVSAHECPGR